MVSRQGRVIAPLTRWNPNVPYTVARMRVRLSNMGEDVGSIRLCGQFVQGVQPYHLSFGYYNVPSNILSFFPACSRNTIHTKGCHFRSERIERNAALTPRVVCLPSFLGLRPLLSTFREAFQRCPEISAKQLFSKSVLVIEKNYHSKWFLISCNRTRTETRSLKISSSRTISSIFEAKHHFQGQLP